MGDRRDSLSRDRSRSSPFLPLNRKKGKKKKTKSISSPKRLDDQSRCRTSVEHKGIKIYQSKGIEKEETVHRRRYSKGERRARVRPSIVKAQYVSLFSTKVRTWEHAEVDLEVSNRNESVHELVRRRGTSETRRTRRLTYAFSFLLPFRSVRQIQNTIAGRKRKK